MENVIVHKEIWEGKIGLQWIEECGRQSYRFVWKNTDGKFRRGAPRIPAIEVIFILFAKASKEGWLGQPEKGEPYVKWMRRSRLKLDIGRQKSK